MPYHERILDGVLDAVFPDLAAIAIEGAKGVGKTALAKQRANTIFALDDEQQRELIVADMHTIASAAPPVLLDEWQLAPGTWDAVRRAVDERPEGGRFLLTGSASVESGTRLHSGAGRIVSMKMRPLTIAERGVAAPTVSLAALLNGDHQKIEGSTTARLSGYVDEIVRSGFPGIRPLPDRARRLQLDGYLSRIVERELPEAGLMVRRPAALTAWLAAYGAATASTASYSTILDAATAGVADKPSRSAVDGYREHLQRIFVLDPVPAWTPAFTPLTRLALSPKHHLVDPALAARLLRVDERDLLSGGGNLPALGPASFLGALFESLVTQSVRVYAEAAEASVGHLRSQDGRREIDLIVEGPGRRVVAIEVKLAATVSDRDVRHLNWLHEELGDRVAERVVVTTGNHAYRRPDGVAVVPLALLGP